MEVVLGVVPFTLLAFEVFEADFGLLKSLNALLKHFACHLLHGVLAEFVHFGIDGLLFGVLRLLDQDQILLVALVLADFLLSKVVNDLL